MLRRLHACLAIVVAPTILFFSFTGAFQLFDLHEAHGRYRPPVVIQELARLHKDQVFAPEPQRSRTSAAPEPESEPEPADPAPTVVLRWVFLIAAITLSLSTGLGLWIGLRQLRRRRLRWILLACGAIVPTVLAAL